MNYGNFLTDPYQDDYKQRGAYVIHQLNLKLPSVRLIPSTLRLELFFPQLNQPRADQKTDHVAQHRPTCDQHSQSTAPCQLERHTPRRSNSSSGVGGGGGWFVDGLRGSRKDAARRRSTFCKKACARTRTPAVVALRLCRAPGRVSGSGQ